MTLVFSRICIHGKLQVRHTKRSYFMNTTGLENFLTENDIILEENIFCWTMCQNEEELRQYLNAASSMLFEKYIREIFISRQLNIKFGTLSRCRPIYTSNINNNQSVQKSEFMNDNSISPESNANHDQTIKYTSNDDLQKIQAMVILTRVKTGLLLHIMGNIKKKQKTNRFPKRNCVVISSECEQKQYLEDALVHANLSGLLTPTNPKGPYVHVHCPLRHPVVP